MSVIAHHSRLSYAAYQHAFRGQAIKSSVQQPPAAQTQAAQRGDPGDRVTLSSPKQAAVIDVEQLVGHVLTFVDAALQQARDQGMDQQGINELTDQARQGVERGFAQAKEILIATQVMNDALDQQLNDALTQLHDALTDDRAPLTPRASARVYTEVDAAQSQQTDLSLRLVTQQGDVITVSAQYQHQQALSIRQNALAAYSQQQQYGQLSVEGHLNADEQHALYQVLGDVDQLTTHFSNNRYQAAYAQASSWQLNAQFSKLDVQMTQQQRAIHRYQQIQANAVA